jgi:hypothetical protein
LEDGYNCPGDPTPITTPTVIPTPTGTPTPPGTATGTTTPTPTIIPTATQGTPFATFVPEDYGKEFTDFVYILGEPGAADFGHTWISPGVNAATCFSVGCNPGAAEVAANGTNLVLTGAAAFIDLLRRNPFIVSPNVLTPGAPGQIYTSTPWPTLGPTATATLAPTATLSYVTPTPQVIQSTPTSWFLR